ncbi:NUDIX hydrolase [Tessaracoccus sp. OH4464_COT-324]|uniref:NUDIX hydrolase n=1 Tax=Tessaracoccus sp. OH4464_COT-324 TaxID=2491059 RepID=UPI000F6320C3|nr:NUDIX hydrolase [Tessaracoccus sp. OH4464_COT-324]RRD46466.1 NUDIX domain-containing protein [Tessaracoccus sp. OH4464_COT-324]
MQCRECAYDEGGAWFRLRAAAVIMHDSQVLMMSNPATSYFYSVGGAIEHGESAEDAVRREVREELGLDLEVDRLLFVHENVFTDATTDVLRGKLCHEVALYFLMRYAGESFEVNSCDAYGQPEDAVWLPVAEFASYPAYPRFFATELAELPASPKHIVTRDVTHDLS